MSDSWVRPHPTVTQHIDLVLFHTATKARGKAKRFHPKNKSKLLHSGRFLPAFPGLCLAFPADLG